MAWGIIGRESCMMAVGGQVGYKKVVVQLTISNGKEMLA